MQHFHAAGPADPRLRNLVTDVPRPPVPAAIESIVVAARAF
jgi:hypothetical protein